jgi:hypothetical protein
VPLLKVSIAVLALCRSELPSITWYLFGSMAPEVRRAGTISGWRWSFQKAFYHHKVSYFESQTGNECAKRRGQFTYRLICIAYNAMNLDTRRPRCFPSYIRRQMDPLLIRRRANDNRKNSRNN